MAVNQEYKEYRVNDLPSTGYAGDRYYLNVGGGKFQTYIISDALTPVREAGQEFIECDNVVDDLRNLDARQIWAIENGYYKGVTLNGYYAKGDTPAPIQYYLSDTTESDDGGSVFVVGGIKLEHEFKDIINLAYFGVINGFDDGSRLNEVIGFFPKFTNIAYEVSDILDISQRISINNPVQFNKLKIKTVDYFTTRSIEILSSNVIINGFYFNGNNQNNYAVFIHGNNIIFDGVEVFDLKENVGLNGESTRGFHVSTTSNNVHIRNGSIKNIIPIENGTSGDEQGSARAITMRGIYNCSIENIETDNIQGFEDGDVFHIQSVLDPDTQEWSKIDVTVKNCRLYNIYKSGIKIQASGVKATGNYIYSNWTSSITTHAGIRDYGTGNIIDSNIIKLNRAKACIIGGAQGYYDNAVITNNYLEINPIGEWTSTTASGNRIGTLYLERPVRNLTFSNNVIEGFGNIECTVNQQINSSKFNRNTFRNSGINLNYSADTLANIIDSEILGNTFYYTNATSSDSSVIRLRNPNGLLVLDNSFYNVNRPISLLGEIGNKRCKVKINHIGSIQSVPISVSGVTSGNSYVDLLSDKSMSLTNDSNQTIEFVSSLDANLIRGTKTLISTSMLNSPFSTGILVNYEYNENAAFQWFFGYSSDSRVFYRRKSSGVYSSWEGVNQLASTTIKGLVNQSAAEANITTADATNETEAISLVNELKAKINAMLTSDRASGQRAT